MAPLTAVVQRVTGSTTISPAGAIIPAYTVTFAVGPDGPFTLTIPASEFTAAAVQQKIAAFAAELGQLPRGG